MEDILRFENVSIYYAIGKNDEICAIKDFSYTFKKGKKYAIIGYSGSGKTSLVQAITGSLVFDGKILLNNQNIESIPIKERNVAFVNQKIALFPHLTIYDNIVFPLRNDKVDHDYADDKVKEVSKRLNIFYLLSRKPKHISLGQASRVAIAKTLVKRNDLIIYDEPLSNLDVLTAKKTLKYIKEVADNYNSTVIFITHDVNEAINIADQILVLNEGQLVGDYSPKSFLNTDNEIVKTLRLDLKKNEKD